MQNPCEQCGSTEFETRWKGLCYQFRCAKCNWGAVTTRLPPVLADKNLYRITITSLGMDANRTLLALNRHLQYGIARTRELFSSSPRELFHGRASEVWPKAHYLRSEGVPFTIEPLFPYDLLTYDFHHGHEHEWQPENEN